MTLKEKTKKQYNKVIDELDAIDERADKNFKDKHIKNLAFKSVGKAKKNYSSGFGKAAKNYTQPKIFSK